MKTQLLQLIKQTFLYVKALLAEPKPQEKPSYLPESEILGLNPDYAKHEFMEMKNAYLKSKEWKNKRLLVLKRDKHKCTNCNTFQNLTVHHDSGYEQIPYEPISCLRTLCKKCHTQLHTELGYPQTIEDYYVWDSHNFKFKEPHGKNC